MNEKKIEKLLERTNDLLYYDGTDVPFWYYEDFKGEEWVNWTNGNNSYSNKQFLKRLTQERKEPIIIRIFNVFLYSAMIIVDWLKEKIMRNEV